jgi:hypothetical protein
MPPTHKDVAVMKTLILVGLSIVLVGCDLKSMAPTVNVPAPIVNVPAPIVNIPDTNPRFAIFKTKNVWNSLLLDTRNGRLYQVQFSIDSKGGRFVLPINPNFKDAPGRDGRFTLMITDNIWNAVLLDQDNGGVWQCQFTLTDKNRFCDFLGSPDLR